VLSSLLVLLLLCVAGELSITFTDQFAGQLLMPLTCLSLLTCAHRMVLSLRAFQDEHRGVGTGRIGTSGHASADDTELSQRGHTKSNGSATPTPNGGPMSSIFKLPSLAGAKGGRKNRRGTNSQDVALDGVVVSVDRLEKSDGQIDTGKRGGNGRAMESDPEKGILQPRGSSLYSHEDRVSVSFRQHLGIVGLMYDASMNTAF
jgi:hypothetical protein